MGRPLIATRVGRFTKRMNFLEELRASLPVSIYLTMLHEAAVTGRIPKYHPQSHARLPEQQQDSEPLLEQERAKLLQYLIDKALPTYSHVTAPEAAGAIDVSDLSGATDSDFTTLSTEQLRQIASAASKLADAGQPTLAAPEPTTAATAGSSLGAELAPVHPGRQSAPV